MVRMLATAWKSYRADECLGPRLIAQCASSLAACGVWWSRSGGWAQSGGLDDVADAMDSARAQRFLV